jgi:hypothetical protein
VSSEGILLDRRGSEIGDLTEACEHAAQVVQKCISTPGPQDWRSWIVKVDDGDGEELFALPFSMLFPGEGGPGEPGSRAMNCWTVTSA